MIPVEQAVRVATRELKHFLGGSQPQGLRVEEAIPSDDETKWNVTLSYMEPTVKQPEPRLLKLGLVERPPPLERVLRVVVVDATTGEAVAMRMREAS